MQIPCWYKLYIGELEGPSKAVESHEDGSEVDSHVIIHVKFLRVSVGTRSSSLARIRACTHTCAYVLVHIRHCISAHLADTFQIYLPSAVAYIISISTVSFETAIRPFVIKASHLWKAMLRHCKTCYHKTHLVESSSAQFP